MKKHQDCVKTSRLFYESHPLFPEYILLMMTVCELDDLLIYNGIIKCLNKKHVKPGDDGQGDGEQGSQDEVIKYKTEPNIAHM